jgi:hypothetical protein
MNKPQDIESKTWRKDKNDGCLCQSLKQFQGCKYFPIDKTVCPFLDQYNYFKCVLKVSA